MISYIKNLFSSKPEPHYHPSRYPDLGNIWAGKDGEILSWGNAVEVRKCTENCVPENNHLVVLCNCIYQENGINKTDGIKIVVEESDLKECIPENVSLDEYFEAAKKFFIGEIDTMPYKLRKWPSVCPEPPSLSRKKTIEPMMIRLTIDKLYSRTPVKMPNTPVIYEDPIIQPYE